MAAVAKKSNQGQSVREIEKGLKMLNERLDELSKPKSSVTNPGVLFGGFQKGDGASEWPWEQIHKMSEKAYGADWTKHMAYVGGKQLTTGMGPALKRMAEIACRKGNYDKNMLEKEYGFVDVDKASQYGIKMPNGEIRKTALAESAGVTGGYIVPPQFMNELLRIMVEQSQIQQRARVIPMTTRTLQIPMLDVTTVQSTGITPSLGGIQAKWQPEASTIAETEPQFKQAELTAWDLVLYTVSSNQLLADNAIGLDALLSQMFADAATWYKEYAFINGLGAGSSMPLGVLNSPACISVNRAASNKFNLVDAASMMAKLHMYSWDNCTWVMHPSVIGQLIQMTNGATNAPFLTWLNPVPGSGDGPATQKFPKVLLNGMPIIFTEKCPSIGSSGDVILVDWSYYLVGNRMEYTIDVSDHVKFATNQLAWRLICRCDGRPWLNSYITDAQGYTNSPFVYLNAST